MTIIYIVFPTLNVETTEIENARRLYYSFSDK